MPLSQFRMETPGDTLGSYAHGLGHLGYQGTWVSDGPASVTSSVGAWGAGREGSETREFAGNAIVAPGEMQEGREPPSLDWS